MDSPHCFSFRLNVPVSSVNGLFPNSPLDANHSLRFALPLLSLLHPLGWLPKTSISNLDTFTDGIISLFLLSTHQRPWRGPSGLLRLSPYLEFPTSLTLTCRPQRSLKVLRSILFLLAPASTTSTLFVFFDRTEHPRVEYSSLPSSPTSCEIPRTALSILRCCK